MIFNREFQFDFQYTALNMQDAHDAKVVKKTEDLIDGIIKDFDLDKDGKLSLQELKKGIEAEQEAKEKAGIKDQEHKEKGLNDKQKKRLIHTLDHIIKDEKASYNTEDLRELIADQNRFYSEQIIKELYAPYMHNDSYKAPNLNETQISEESRINASEKLIKT